MTASHACQVPGQGLWGWKNDIRCVLVCVCVRIIFFYEFTTLLKCTTTTKSTTQKVAKKYTTEKLKRK